MFSSVQFTHSVVSDSVQHHGLQHTRLPVHHQLMFIESVMTSNHLFLCHPLLLLPSISPSNRVSSNEPVLHIRWSKYWNFSFSSVLPKNIQDWFHLGLTGWISLQSKGLSWAFSSVTVWKHHFFGARPSLWSSSLIFTWLSENHSFDYKDLCWQSNVFAF